MKDIKIVIIKSHRRTISLHIQNQGELIVKAPLFAPNFFINRFIDKNTDWIEKKMQQIISRKVKNKSKLDEGEKLLYLGNEYTIIFVKGSQIEIKGDKILVPIAAKFRLDKELNNWIIKQARETITKQVEYYANLMKARYTDLKFSDTKSQWGRCTYDNKLQFSWRLIMAPILVVNYVVVHELAHTVEKNHSKAFWSKVRLFNPSYKQQIKWLRENGHSLKD